MYHIREVSLKHKNQVRKRLVIEFDNVDMAIVGEFLMVDAQVGDWSVLDDLNDVLNGEWSQKRVSGNRVGMVVTKETTRLYDLFTSKENIPTYMDYTIRTDVLQDLVVMWQQQTAGV